MHSDASGKREGNMSGRLGGDIREKRLTKKQARFVKEFLKDMNGAAAARRAGYSEKTARTIANENLTKPDIRAAIESETAQLFDELTVTDKMVLRGLMKRAFYDVRDFFDDKGNPKEIHELDEQTAAGIAGFEFVTLYDGSGDQKHAFGQLRKIRLVDAGINLERLGRYLGLFKDRLQIEPKDEFAGRTKEELHYYATHDGQWPPNGPGTSESTQASSGRETGQGNRD
jgi:phage terminase small subunit